MSTRNQIKLQQDIAKVLMAILPVSCMHAQFHIYVKQDAQYLFCCWQNNLRLRLFSGRNKLWISILYMCGAAVGKITWEPGQAVCPTRRIMNFQFCSTQDVRNYLTCAVKWQTVSPTRSQDRSWISIATYHTGCEKLKLIAAVKIADCKPDNRSWIAYKLRIIRILWISMQDTTAVKIARDREVVPYCCMMSTCGTHKELNHEVINWKHIIILHLKWFNQRQITSEVQPQNKYLLQKLVAARGIPQLIKPTDWLAFDLG